MKKILFLIVPLVLGGCAASGALFVAGVKPAPDKANVYVYRPERTINCCVAPYVFVNNDRRGQLTNGGYLLFRISPGPVTVEAVNETVGFDSLKLTIDARPGQTYYFRWSAAATFGIRPSETAKDITAVDAEIFASEEAKKRAEEASVGKLANVQRATDFQVRDRPGASFVVSHEREFRVVDEREALSEIVLTRKAE